MAIRDVFKISRKTFFNPAGWIGAGAIRDQNATIWTVLKTYFTIAKPTREETFKQAKERLQLNDADIANTSRSYRSYAILLAVFGFCVFFYSFYLLFLAAFFGFILGICVSALFFAQAFRYSFWAYQMHAQKLGVSFEEWKQHILGGPTHHA